MQVEESQVFREAVSRHGLTYTYARFHPNLNCFTRFILCRYCKDTETLQEENVGQQAESTSVRGKQEMATGGSHITSPPTLRGGHGRGATSSYGVQDWEMSGAVSCASSAHQPVRASVGRGAGRSSDHLVDDQRLKGGERRCPPDWWRRESSMVRGRGRGFVQRGGGSSCQPLTLYSDFEEEGVNYGCVSQDGRAPLVGNLVNN